MLRAGTPHSVQIVQKIGLPVAWSPTGASLGVAGVSTASKPPSVLSRASASSGICSSALK